MTTTHTQMPQKKSPQSGSRVLRDLAPRFPSVKGGTLTYTNSFTCLPDSTAASRPAIRIGTWILDSSL